MDQKANIYLILIYYHRIFNLPHLLYLVYLIYYIYIHNIRHYFMNQFGFIITRHVNSVKTNKYWNISMKLLRRLYPHAKIVIIDDNSLQEFVVADFDYQNLTIIKSDYPGRGELLPYIYFLKHKWFENAIILHDSVFIHKRIPFEQYSCPILPLWHSTYFNESFSNLLRISSYLKNSQHICYELEHLRNECNATRMALTSITQPLCFGVMSYINLDFLQQINKKYEITNLTNAIRCRNDRCGLERIMGLIFTIEYPTLYKCPSLFGDILRKYKTLNYSLDNYESDFNSGKLPSNFIKIWTGR